MDYYQARELTDADGKPTGKWHFTVRNDGLIWATGYCSKWETCPACGGRCGTLRYGLMTQEAHCATCEDKGIVERAEPCPGHDTPEGAREHYRQYLLDQVNYHGALTDQQLQCQVCGAWTQREAFIPGHGDRWALCDDHCNRETVDSLLNAPEYIVSSY